MPFVQTTNVHKCNNKMLFVEPFLEMKCLNGAKEAELRVKLVNWTMELGLGIPQVWEADKFKTAVVIVRHVIGMLLG